MLVDDLAYDIHSLRQDNVSYEQFKRLLKSFLFGAWDCNTWWLA